MPPVVPVDKDILCNIFSDKLSIAALFPEGILIRCHAPFEIRKCNIPLILSENFAEMFATKASDRHYTSISLSCATEIPSGLDYVIEYQGQQSPEIIIAHIVQHLVKVPKYYIKGQVDISIFIIDFASFNTVLQALTKFNKHMDFTLPALFQGGRTFLQYTMNHVKTPITRKYANKL